MLRDHRKGFGGHVLVEADRSFVEGLIERQGISRAALHLRSTEATLARVLHLGVVKAETRDRLAMRVAALRTQGAA